MGEIADDMVDGSACTLCGVYFEKQYGYPVVCKDCYKGMDAEAKKQYQLAD